MTDLADKLVVSELYNIYGDLLTTKQQSMFELYYFEDYSIIEIAQMNDITKNAVYNSIKKSIKQLEKYEENLQVKANYQHNIELLKKHEVCEDVINAIK